MGAFIEEGEGALFLNDPEIRSESEIINPTVFVCLEEYPAMDLERYCTKLFYSKDIPVDYNKVIKTALAHYLDSHIGEKELKEIENIKAKEVKRIEEAKEKEIPVFNWDLSNRKKKKK